MRALIADEVDELLIQALHDMGVEVIYSPGISRERLLDSLGGAEMLVVRGRTLVDGELMDSAPRLKLIVRAGTGLDNIRVEEANRRGIMVLNAPEAPVESVAELAVGLIIAAARRLKEAIQSTSSGGWRRVRGLELRGKRLAVLGFGRIGRRVAEICSKGLGMDVVAYDAADLGPIAREQGIEFTNHLYEAVRGARFLTVHLPLTSETRYIVNRRLLNMLGDSAVVVNTSRGAVIDEEALLEALESGKVFSAALDVLSEEPPRGGAALSLAKHPRVIVTPHIGSETYEAQRRIAEVLSAKIARALEALEGEA